MHNKSLNPDPLKYVAIGDSIAAGFNIKLEKDIPGKYYDQTTPQLNNISGLSYPAYFSQFVNEVDEEILHSFANYAISGSTFSNWTHLLRGKNSAFFKRSLNETFESYFDALVNDLQKANLITISLGANDFLQLFLKNISTFFTASKVSFEDLGNEIRKALKRTFKTIEKRAQRFSEVLSSFNTHAKIYFVSYPLSLLRLSKAIDQFANYIISKAYDNADTKEIYNFFPHNEDFESHSLSEALITTLNSSLKEIIESQNLGTFLSLYNKKEWHTYARHYAQNIFDIHPSALGYKTMGYALFKEVSNVNVFKKSFYRKKSTFKKELSAWNDDPKIDVYEEHKAINFEKHFIYHWNLGTYSQNSRCITKELRFEVYQDKLNYENYRLKLTHFLQSRRDAILNSIYAFAMQNKYTTEEIRETLLELREIRSGEFLNELFLVVTNSYFLQDIIVLIQENDDKYARLLAGIYDLKKFRDVLKKHFKRADNYLPLLKSLILLSRSCRHDIESFVVKFSKTLFNSEVVIVNLVNLLARKRRSKTTKRAIVNLIRTMSKLEHFEKFVAKGMNNMLNNPIPFLNAQSMNEFFTLFVSQSKQATIDLIQGFVRLSIESDDYEILLGLISKETLAVLKLASLNSKTKESIQNNIPKLIESLENSDFSVNIYQNLLSRLRTYPKQGVGVSLIEAIKASFRNHFISQRNSSSKVS